MKVRCPKCRESEFSVLENMNEVFDYKEGIGKVIKDLSCDCCGTTFLAKMDIEITAVDIDKAVPLKEGI